MITHKVLNVETNEEIEVEIHSSQCPFCATAMIKCEMEENNYIYLKIGTCTHKVTYLGKQPTYTLTRKGLNLVEVPCFTCEHVELEDAKIDLRNNNN